MPADLRTPRGFAARKRMLFLHVVFVVFNRAGLKRKKGKGKISIRRTDFVIKYSMKDRP